MEYSVQFDTARFSEALAQVARMHLTTVEKAYRDYAGEADELIRQIEALSEDQVHESVHLIRNSSLELLLPALKKVYCPDTKNKFLYILKHRAKKRLFYLNWALLQDNYRNSNLLESMSILCNYMKINFKGEYEKTLPMKLIGDPQILLNLAVGILTDEGEDIGEFLRKYDIIAKSDFAADLCFQFFTRCSRDGLAKNKNELADIIKNSDENKVIPIVDNYLRKLGILEFSGTINTVLLKRFGEPKADSAFWQCFNDELKVKLTKWIKIKDMEEHFAGNEKRYRLWLSYYDDIRSIRRDKRDNILFVDFGSFVVVDLGTGKQDTYLYRKKAFDVKYEQYMTEKEYGGSGWPVSEDEAMSGRNAFLDDLYADMYLLNYESAGILYIKEIVNRELKRSKNS